VDLDGLGIDFEPLFLVDEEVFHGIALVALELDDLSGARVGDNGAIASELLLDDLENLLEIKLRRNALDRGQGFASIALLDANVDVLSFGLCTSVSRVLVLRIREGIERLEVLDIRGHTMLCRSEYSKCS